MVLPQPGCATATALAGTIHTLIGILYQGLVTGGNLLAEWCSKPPPALAFCWQPLPAAVVFPTTAQYYNNMLLPQPGCATGTALAGTVHTLIGISYQGLVAGGNLVAEL